MSSPVPYRRILDLKPCPQADIDAAEAASAAFIAGAEDDLSMLARLAAIGMEAAEAQGAYLKARLAAAAGGEAPLKPGEDPAAPLNKLAQTVRRTVALKRRIAEDLEKHRRGFSVENAARRERRAQQRRRAVANEIENALTEAFTVVYGDGEDETEEGHALCQEMLADKEDLLEDLDDTGAWLERPVGETVAMLCDALGLPAGTCVKQDGAWRINCHPTPWQSYVATRAAALPMKGREEARGRDHPP